MKRTKKFLVGFLATLGVLAGSLGLAACGGNDSSTSSGEATEIEKVYAQYVVYAQAEGQTPLSYEEWLATIKGEKGDKGDKGDTGVGIDKVELDENGNLVITLTDGTKLPPIEMPKTESSESNSLIDKGATEGLHYQKINGKEEYRVIGLGLAAESDIVISSTYKGLSVTEIGEKAFYVDAGFMSSLTSITIPDSVTSIGYEAFYNCDSLTSVAIGDSVTSISGGAFQGCSNLTSIEIPDSVTSIGDSAFDRCDNLEYNVKDNLQYLGNEQNPYLYLAGVHDTSITNATIESTCKFIGAYAFYDCSSLTSVNIPNGVTSIGYEAFRDCSSLTSVTIGDSVISIGNSAFSGCSSLKYNEKDNLKYLGNEQKPYLYLVGVNDTSITSATIESTCKLIGNSAFYDCDSLASITFNGTKAQWNAIEKGSWWNDNVPAKKVVCSDGEVAL